MSLLKSVIATAGAAVLSAMSINARAEYATLGVAKFSGPASFFVGIDKGICLVAIDAQFQIK